MKPTKKIVKVKPHKISVTSTTISKPDYDKDFFKWTKSQANLLKKGHFDQLDIKNLKEEIESLGRNDKRSLRSFLVVLLMHKLKLNYQPHGKGNSNSWNSSIQNAALEIELLLQDSPSLKNELLKLYPDAYEFARKKAVIETKLSIKTFPEKCPWKIEEVLPFIKKNKK